MKWLVSMLQKFLIFRTASRYYSHIIWDICLLLENLLLCLIARFFLYSCLGQPRSQWPAQAALGEKSSDETHFKKVAVNLTVPYKLCEDYVTYEQTPGIVSDRSKSSGRLTGSWILLRLNSASRKDF